MVYEVIVPVFLELNSLYQRIWDRKHLGETNSIYL